LLYSRIINPVKLPWIVAALVLALTLLRFVFATMSELVPEEAYYWIYWKHPAMGYFDHPPMVAWIVGSGTSIFGDTEFGVRFGTIILSAISSLLVFKTSKLWFGALAATRAAVIYTLLPVFAGAGFIVTPDQPLLFFWLLALLGFSHAVKTGHWKWWLLGGVAFGGALLSKYYALLLGPSLLLFLLLSKQHRHWLRRPHPWLAFAVALIVFSPTIIWNEQHQWASFLYQSARTGTPHHHGLRYFFRFWGLQFVIVTPLVFALFIVAVLKGIRHLHNDRTGDDRWNYALSFSLPLFLLFGAASLKTEVHVNWTAPAFLSLLPAAMQAYETMLATASLQRMKWLRVCANTSIALCVIAIVVGLASITWGVPRLYEQAGGWRALAAAVEQAEDRLKTESGAEPFVLDTGKYDSAVEVSFYSREPDEQVNNYALGKSGLGFRYWTKLQRFQGMPAVALLDELDTATLRHLSDCFAKTGEPIPLQIKGPGRHERHVYLVECYDYRLPRPE